MGTGFFTSPLVLQLLVVVSSDWDGVDATLYRFERDASTLQWEQQGIPIPVVLGSKGIAWGQGLMDFSDQQGPTKKEGDSKSPAGIFYLGPAFGDSDHQNNHVSSIPFLLITEDLECVDDPKSLHYNQFVNANSVQHQDWKSSEKMKEIGPLYALGLVVQHNLHPIQPGRGSAIFMHLWHTKGKGTHGCTAMTEYHLNEIIAWLSAEKCPCLVQLPMEEYARKQVQWGLPALLLQANSEIISSN